MKPLPLSPPGRRGFTLIEVMLAIAILVLLMGGLFGTVRATVKACGALRETQQARERIDGFFLVCQQTFPALPAPATLVTVPAGPGSPAVSLVLRNAPAALAVGARGVFFGETAVVARPQNNGGLTLGIEYRQIDPQTNQVRPDPLWLPLVTDLQGVAWSFYDGQTGQWQERWDDASRHPTLVRLTLVFLGDPQKWTRTFWLPKLLPPATGQIPTSPAPDPTAPPHPSV